MEMKITMERRRLQYPRRKKERSSTVQGLIDLGPLIPRLSIQLPSRRFKVTYINSETQVLGLGHRAGIL